MGLLLSALCDLWIWNNEVGHHWSGFQIHLVVDPTEAHVIHAEPNEALQVLREACGTLLPNTEHEVLLRPKVARAIVNEHRIARFVASVRAPSMIDRPFPEQDGAFRRH